MMVPRRMKHAAAFHNDLFVCVCAYVRPPTDFLFSLILHMLAHQPAADDRFRERYHAECARSVDRMHERWDDLWAHVVRSAAAFLHDGGDAFAVRHRLEDLCDLYRRCLCDPVQMYSLPLQSLVQSHLTERQYRWEKEGEETNETEERPPPRLGDCWDHILLIGRSFFLC